MTDTKLHKDTIIVSTADLKQFEQLCAELGIEFDLYAHPTDMKQLGNCLCRLSDEDINLLQVVKPELFKPEMAGMRKFIGDHLMRIMTAYGNVGKSPASWSV